MIDPDTLPFGSLFFSKYDCSPTRRKAVPIEAPSPQKRRSHRGRVTGPCRGVFEVVADSSLFRMEDDPGSALEPDRPSPVSQLSMIGIF